MAKEEEYVVRAGVTYDAKEAKTIPYGLRWVEVGGVRIPVPVQSVTAHHQSNEFGTVTLVLAGCRFEAVDREEAPEPTDWRAGFVQLVKAMSPDDTVALDQKDWTPEEWALITEHAR